MKHFEIQYLIGSHVFTYECSTAHEAYDVLSDLATHDSKLNIDLDIVMKSLVAMKFESCLSFGSYKYTVRYLDGEV